MSIIYSLHANNAINALFSSYPMSLILRVSSRKGSASMSSLIPYLDYRRAAFRSVEYSSKLCVLLSLTQHLELSSSCFTFGKVEASLTFRSLNQHLFLTLDIDSLRRFLLQPAA